MAQEKTRMNSGQLGSDLIQLKNLKKVIITLSIAVYALHTVQYYRRMDSCMNIYLCTDAGLM